MSIRFRLTLLYSAILSLTLIVFGTALYTIQAEETMSALQAKIQSGNGLAQSILNNYLNPSPPPRPPGPPPVPIETLSGDQAFNQLRERDIIRVLDPNGTLANCIIKKITLRSDVASKMMLLSDSIPGLSEEHHDDSAKQTRTTKITPATILEG